MSPASTSRRRLGVLGAGGRMGRRLVALATGAGCAVTAEVRATGPALDGELAGRVDALVDFTVKAQVARTAAFCEAHRLPLVMGTTGLDADDHAALDAVARVAPVVWAPNFSVGVNALIELVAVAAEMLREGWDVELVEAHHRHKVDAPSGTARALALAAARVRGWDLEAVARHGREGLVGPRPGDELGIHAVRGGSVVGDHHLHFLAEGEEVTLSHRAADRDIFARGALRAASWVLAPGRAPGRYTMGDVLRTS